MVRSNFRFSKLLMVPAPVMLDLKSYSIGIVIESILKVFILFDSTRQQGTLFHNRITFKLKNPFLIANCRQIRTMNYINSKSSFGAMGPVYCISLIVTSPTRGPGALMLCLVTC